MLSQIKKQVAGCSILVHEAQMLSSGAHDFHAGAENFSAEDDVLLPSEVIAPSNGQPRVRVQVKSVAKFLS